MERQTIKYWEEFFKNRPTDAIQRCLKDTLESIAFLESIYITGGANNFYSKQFADAAYNERQALCQLSSACYSILRERSVSPAHQ